VTTTQDQRETARRDTTRRDALSASWVARTSNLLDVLAVIFLFDFAASRLVSGGPPWFHPALDFVSFTIWLAFAIDYVVRLALASHRRTFIGRHKLDLLMVALPMLRILRVVLLLRKSFRSISTERIASSLISIVIGVVVASGILEWGIERNAPGANITTLGTGLWWSIVTTTTVGYGDTYPVTTAGRFVGSVVMVVGIGLIGTVSATVAAWFVSHKQRLQDEKKAAAVAAGPAVGGDGTPAGGAAAAGPIGPDGTIGAGATAESAGAAGTAGAVAGAAGAPAAPETAAGATISVSDSIAALTAKLDELARQQAELVASIEKLSAKR
jgi:voltage-gated potassium channel